MASTLAALLALAVRGAGAVSLQAGTDAAARAEATAAVLQARFELMNQSAGLPLQTPEAQLLEPGFRYEKPPGSGCGKRPEGNPIVRNLLQPAKLLSTPAGPGESSGWNGFCEINMLSCPDAIANKDYFYYAKSLGTNWIKFAGKVDVDYCGNAGLLKPEITRIVRNFTALTEKGHELCMTTFAQPEYHQSELPAVGVGQALMVGVKEAVEEVKADFKNALKTGNLNFLTKHISVMNSHSAGMAAAWNCALGSLACDMAYCNYAYCERPDGSRGIAHECDGWDPVKGMPGTYL